MKLSFRASPAPAAQDLRATLAARYGDHSLEEAETVVAIGGDGFMLETLHATEALDVPVFGLNRGTVGFLMNDAIEGDLPVRISAAYEHVIHPLALTIERDQGASERFTAINEVSVLRHGPQAAHLRLFVDGAERMDRLMADGVMLATPAGSTAYNYSAYGPILPLGANVLALTPIAAFRPRRWRGAVLPEAAHLRIEALDPEKRPVIVSADSASAEGAHAVEIALDRSISHRLLFDPGRGLEERILAEQFT